MNYDNKTVVTAEAKQGIAYLSITGAISSDTTFSASYIRSLVNDFISKGIRNAEVYINCKGGDVFEATEIDNEFSRFDNVTFYAGSVIASAATYITSNPKFKTYAKPNSQVMIHRPMLTTSGDVNTVRSDISLLENMTNEYKKRYALKTGMSEDVIEALWNAGDYWMTAEVAYQKGFISGVIADEKNDITAIAYGNVIAYASSVSNTSHSSWTLEDYLDKDPKAYEQMKVTNPQLAAQLEQQYFGKSYRPEIGNNKISSQLPMTVVNDYVGWTLEDYLDKDPKAYEQMKVTNPQLAAQLERQYFAKPVNGSNGTSGHSIGCKVTTYGANK